MVTPYTNRLFNRIVEIAALDLSVVSCTAREKNRNWQDQYAGCYNHTILPGVEFALPNSRSAHFNLGMWRTLRGLSLDLVAINGVYPTMLIAALWSYLHRKPLVFLTDGWRKLMPQSFYHRVVRPLVVNGSAAIICASEKGRQFFLEEGVEPQRIFVASIVPLWDGPRERLDFDQRSYDVLWCGRVCVEWKNWPFFVALAIELHKRLPEIRIRIVGDSRSPPETLACLSAAGVNFEYTAYVPPEEIASVFAAARLLAVPSRHEAWGLVCNEAMQCGTPCAVSPLTGAAGELVIDGVSGFVLDLDVIRWANTISTVLADRAAWSAMSDAAVTAVARYSLERSAREYAEGLNFAARSIRRGQDDHRGRP
jgi:glycosyltransferase involved in cell wall biosynthesis